MIVVNYRCMCHFLSFIGRYLPRVLERMNLEGADHSDPDRMDNLSYEILVGLQTEAYHERFSRYGQIL